MPVPWQHQCVPWSPQWCSSLPLDRDALLTPAISVGHRIQRGAGGFHVGMLKVGHRVHLERQVGFRNLFLGGEPEPIGFDCYVIAM